LRRSPSALIDSSERPASVTWRRAPNRRTCGSPPALDATPRFPGEVAPEPRAEVDLLPHPTARRDAVIGVCRRRRRRRPRYVFASGSTRMR
jgi:hypothetical protein